MVRDRITVLGAGIVGLWQAYTLLYRGHSVRLVERTATPFSNAASQLAGAMLAEGRAAVAARKTPAGAGA